MHTLSFRPRRTCPAGVRLGFTLIELLVVIAIIAVLTSILLPVFSSVRAKARQTVCVSNTRQIGMALTQYTQDFDETLPSLTASQPTAYYIIVDAYQTLMPYVNNLDVFHCPERTVQCTPAVTGVVSPYPDQTCIGYGYNDGPIFPGNANQTGGGLIQKNLYNATTGVLTLIGVPISQITAPATTFAFGDTYDTPFYTITIDAILSSYNGTTNSQLRHGSRFSMVFCDGHVKTVLWHGGKSTQYGKIAMPVDPSYWPGWCADPDTIVIYDGAGDMLPCGQIPAHVASSGVTWFPN